MAKFLNKWSTQIDHPHIFHVQTKISKTWNLTHMKTLNNRRDMDCSTWCKMTTSLPQRYSTSNRRLRAPTIRRLSQVLHRQNYSLSSIKGRPWAKTQTAKIQKTSKMTYRIKNAVLSKKSRGRRSNSPVSSVLERGWLKFRAYKMYLNKSLRPISS